MNHYAISFLVGALILAPLTYYGLGFNENHAEKTERICNLSKQVTNGALEKECANLKGVEL